MVMPQFVTRAFLILNFSFFLPPRVRRFSSEKVSVRIRAQNAFEAAAE
jgi:hypothetical protein